LIANFSKDILQEIHFGILDYHQTRKLCMGFVIQIKLCLLTKDCRLRKTFGLVEFCGALRKWWKSGTMANDRCRGNEIERIFDHFTL